MAKKVSFKTRRKRYASRHTMRLSWMINRVRYRLTHLPLEPIEEPEQLKAKHHKKPSRRTSPKRY